MMQPSKIVCVGRNYAEHAKELGNAIPEQPVLFIKPPSSLATMAQGVRWPQGMGECHFECEICLRIDQPLRQVSNSKHALQAVGAITLGLDLTLRDVQNQLKQKGQPWERAKAFDGACVLGDWLDIAEVIQCEADWQQLQFEFAQNGTIQQRGCSSEMIFDIGYLLCDISQNFSLQVGDVIMTGTPAGVGALNTGDQLRLTLYTKNGLREWQTVCV